MHCHNIIRKVLFFSAFLYIFFLLPSSFLTFIVINARYFTQWIMSVCALIFFSQKKKKKIEKQNRFLNVECHTFLWNSLDIHIHWSFGSLVAIGIMVNRIPSKCSLGKLIGMKWKAIYPRWNHIGFWDVFFILSHNVFINERWCCFFLYWGGSSIIVWT